MSCHEHEDKLLATGNSWQENTTCLCVCSISSSYEKVMICLNRNVSLDYLPAANNSPLRGRDVVA